MLIAELIHSCSHESIAHAALMSIGPDYHRRVGAVAQSFGQSAAAFAAARVSEFARKAGEEKWTAIARVMSGEDMPLLSGLRYILDPHLPHYAARRCPVAVGGHTYWMKPDCRPEGLHPAC